MISSDHLKICTESIQAWDPQGEEPHGLSCNIFWGPIARLAIERDGGIWDRLGQAVRPNLNGFVPMLHDVESLLTRSQQQVLAEACYDWTAWTMRHGLGPGIMTALKNGQKEQVLEAIERDLAQAE